MEWICRSCLSDSAPNNTWSQIHGDDNQNLALIIQEVTRVEVHINKSFPLNYKS